MRYQCLVFDHDDTTVNSTATIHHPAFVKFLQEYFPGRTCSLEDYFLKNFEPGFIEMCVEEYGMNAHDLEVETQFWLNYVKDHIPVAYPGIAELMHRQKAEGGAICVVSHSMKQNILRDYKANGLPEPDLVFGWEEPPEHRKPNIWPLEKIMKDLDLKPKDLLMIDDLKPGYDMARNAGVDFAAVGWANDITEIEAFMRSNCRYYFKTVEELAAFVADD
ncbi:MAG: HAD hydrolase-like protein [Oscillospiraceae bacterium]|nr:HAD hydrolase-like protein [Oscillospiraceae bacterium]